MSSTQITIFGKNGKPIKTHDIRNAWRGAMAIWNIMDLRYLPKYTPKWAEHLPPREQPYHRMSDYDNKDAAQQIWSLMNDVNVPMTDRIVIGTTLDWCLVYRENIAEVIEAFRNFEGETSLKEQADILEEEFKNEDAIAVGWNQTSVCENRWTSYKHHNITGEGFPYNLKKHKEHWNLFEKESA